MLPTPTTIAIVPGHLAAFETAHNNGLEVTISKSMHVRPKDPTFKDVLQRLDSRCLSIIEKYSFADDQMAFGTNQFYVLMAHHECPDEAHLCSKLTDPVEAVF